MSVHLDRQAIDAFVLDIEGTTTPVAFVYGTLFPYARRHLREYLRQQRGTEELGNLIQRLREEWTEDLARGEMLPRWAEEGDAELSAVAAYVDWLMDRDRKSPGLKQLQGCIWERGYRSGFLKTELFSDVAPAIRRWHDLGLRVAIYSSGSRLAQRLLFAHTPVGDLTPCLSGFFDTTVGPKTSADSYRRIAATLQCPTDRLLFVSDAVKELEAAHEAGCRVVMSVRPGNVDQGPAAFDTIRSFDEIINGQMTR